MIDEPVELDDLLNTRTILISKIRNELTEDERKFILSVKNKKPAWELLGIKGIEDMPAIKWKLMNINRMKPDKHKLAYDKLEKYLLG